jgi:hypothetical protein
MAALINHRRPAPPRPVRALSEGSHGRRRLRLNHVLRDTWGFDGYITS